MGIFSWTVGLPLQPVRGLIALAETIQRQAEQQLNDPTVMRRQLEELEDARERGEITAEQENEAQEEILKARMSDGGSDSA